VGCRSGHIVVFNTETGKELQALPINEGTDDLTFDPGTKRLYAACDAGAGSINVFEETDPDHYKSLVTIPSGPSGRNGCSVPELKRYFVTVPQSGDTKAAILVYEVQ
jgi:hypothetical protein